MYKYVFAAKYREGAEYSTGNMWKCVYCKPAPRYTKVTGNKHAYVYMYSHSTREIRRERNHVKVCIARKRNVKNVRVEYSACKVISYECKMPGIMCKCNSERKVKSNKCIMPGKKCAKVPVCKKRYPEFMRECCFGPMVIKYALMVCTKEQNGCIGKNGIYSYYIRDESTAVGRYGSSLSRKRYGNSLRVSYVKNEKCGSTDKKCISVPSKMSTTGRGEEDVEMEDPLPGDKGACRFSICPRDLKSLICLLTEKKSSLNSKKSCRAVISLDCNIDVRCQVYSQLCKTVYICPEWKWYRTFSGSTIRSVNCSIACHCIYDILMLIRICMPYNNKTVSVELRFIIWCSRYGE
jgi:hypothetical protein